MTINVGKLEVDFRLYGCRSLKDKRQRLGRLKDKFGRQSGLAVCESDHQDSHQRGQWTFVSCASSPLIIEQSLAEVERYVTQFIDAEVLDLRRSWL